MKVTKHLAFKTTLALALVGFVSCSSDEEQMEDPVQAEVQSEEEFSQESTDPVGDGVEDGMLAEEATYSDPYGEDEPIDDLASTESDFTDAEFETAVDEPVDNNAQSMTFEPVAPAPKEANWVQKPTSGFNEQQTAAASQYEHAYVVQVGDTLSKIARRIYGNAGRWHKLASMNNISNPHKIFPGDTIFFESSAETDAFAAAFNNVNKQSYTVKAGDTLASISHGVFGTESRWKVLWGYNWKQLSNPHKILVGQQLSYVRKNDMQNFLAGIDANAPASTAKIVSTPVDNSSYKTVSEPMVEEVAPAEEVYEEVIVEEEMPAGAEEEGEYGEIIEDIVVDEDAVIDDEEVFEDFEEAIEE